MAYKIVVKRDATGWWAWLCVVEGQKQHIGESGWGESKDAAIGSVVRNCRDHLVINIEVGVCDSGYGKSVQ